MIIDFETRSLAELRDVGAWAYANHPSTRLMCLGGRSESGGEWLWLPEEAQSPLLPPAICPLFFGPAPPPPLLVALANPLESVIAHNAEFDYAIWHKVGGRLGWPAIPPERWVDTMAMCNAASIPASLNGAAEFLGLTGKDKDGKLLMRRLQKREAGPAPMELLRIGEYCLQDLRVTAGLLQKLPALTPTEQRVWVAHLSINERGVPVDEDFLEAAETLASRYAHDLAEKVVAGVPDFVLDDVKRRDYLLQWVRARGCDLPDLRKETLEELDLDDVRPDVRVVLEARMGASKTSLAKYEAARNYAVNGRVQGQFNYHAALTGRWGGRGVQFQNVPRPDKTFEADCTKILAWDYAGLAANGGVSRTLSKCARGMIHATPGHVLFGGDYSAIEARVVLWLAGDDGGLQVYRDGRDPYKEMAAKIVGRSAAQITPEERQLGKVCVLALSYGMGHAKFEATCSKMGVDLSKFRLDAERVVQIYREANRRITILWRAMENAASHAYVHGRGFVDVGLPGKERQIVFEKRGDTLTMKLPSGRCLSYPHIKSAGGRLSYTGQITGKKAWGHIETYGAKLVENCTQAVSRDILAEAILRLETESRASVVMHVHDEIEAEISEQDDVLAEYEIFKGCMLKVPDWAPGLPLKVETWISKRYKK